MEGVTMALYVAVCLLAALSSVPDDEHLFTIAVVWGTTIGLAAAHWFAFQLGARYMRGGSLHRHDAEAAAAQLGGAVAVAALASVPVLLLDDDVEAGVARLVLAGFIGVVAHATARGSGTSRVGSLAYAGAALVCATAVVLVKNLVVEH